MRMNWILISVYDGVISTSYHATRLVAETHAWVLLAAHWPETEGPPPLTLVELQDESDIDIYIEELPI